MIKVVESWPIFCEQNFTDNGINQKAQVGHAACCLAINSPEYITRMAWGKLTETQQRKANNMAQTAIDKWRLINEY